MSGWGQIPVRKPRPVSESILREDTAALAAYIAEQDEVVRRDEEACAQSGGGYFTPSHGRSRIEGLREALSFLLERQR